MTIINENAISDDTKTENNISSEVNNQNKEDNNAAARKQKPFGMFFTEAMYNDDNPKNKGAMTTTAGASPTMGPYGRGDTTADVDVDF